MFYLLMLLLPLRSRSLLGMALIQDVVVRCSGVKVLAQWKFVDICPSKRSPSLDFGIECSRSSRQYSMPRPRELRSSLEEGCYC